MIKAAGQAPTDPIGGRNANERSFGDVKIVTVPVAKLPEKTTARE